MNSQFAMHLSDKGLVAYAGAILANLRRIRQEHAESLNRWEDDGGLVQHPAKPFSWTLWWEMKAEYGGTNDFAKEIFGSWDSHHARGLVSDVIHAPNPTKYVKGWDLGDEEGSFDAYN